MVSANDIDDGIKVDGFPTTRFGVTLDRLAGVDRINDGDFNDEVDTAGFPRPRCGNTDFSGVNNMIKCLIDLPS